jgi:general secretion pathway protein D
VTTLPQINAVVVSAEPEILKQIERYIISYWDIPLSETEGDLFRIYSLEFADPIIVRDVLQTMLEGGTSGGSRGGAGGPGRAGVGGGRAGAGGGAGGGEADAAVANIFRIEAIPDNRQIIVISRTPENFEWLSQVIKQIDQPTKAGLPLLVQLKHANAVEVSEQLNALLAPPGAQASISDQQTGLNLGQQFAEQLSSPTGGGGGTGGATAGGAGGQGAAPGEITFPWQSSQGAGGEDRALESSIIGKVRIVPIIRQNALSILATPEMQQAVLDIVTALDRPGRQVLVAAVIASVELKDEFAYGLRVSPNGVVSPLPDNSFGGSVNNENTEEGFISGFTTSVLNLNFDAQLLIQALDQKTNAKILQSPKLFVSDNTEGVFFVGQDVPIITSTQINDLGNTNNSFEYQQVGVLLNVRPRITQQRDVSMEINLTLSNIVSGLIVNGGQVFDRRTTQTQITVKNGQTIVLSGIRVETQSDVKRRVPVLGYAPIIGDLLFTSTDTADNVQELLAFITPLVVDNPEENDANFNDDARRRLEDLRRPMSDLIKGGIGNETFDPEHWDPPTPAEPRAPSQPTILLDGGTVPNAAAPPASNNSPPGASPPAPSPPAASQPVPQSGGRVRGMGG